MSKQTHRGRSQGVKSSVREQFSQVAANYSVSPVHASGVELEKMVQAAELTGQETILDAGCGPGHTALAFAPHVARVVAVDLSEAMLEQGRQLAAARGIDNVEFRLGDVEHLPCEDASLDMVATRLSAHHWPNPLSALREFRRVLRDDRGSRAQLLLVDVISSEDFAVDTHVQALELLRDPSHVRDHTTGQWLTMLAVAGFQAEVALTWNLRLDFESWVDRMATPSASRAMIRTLLTNAPEEVRSALKVERDFSFTLRCALLRSVKSDP